ncbi:helix-turn-helix domain-containing protein [Tenacibaculum halocynthiae]|uniref:helix-turn-helix domain-containing protein n=1 Tax=Tenacibaculum halocynthiae TaxID=1254437 RepID=UPI003D655F35
MEILNNIIPIVFILGLIQGVISSGILIYLNKKNNSSTLFLAVFIFIYSIDYIAPISNILKITTNYSQLSFLFDFRWLMFPLFYAYVRQISIFQTSKKIHYYFIPWIVLFTINFLIFFKIIENLWESPWYKMFFYRGSNIFDIFMCIKIISLINRHSLEVKNQYTATKLKELKWAKTFVISGIIFIFAMHIRLLINNFYLDLFEAIINVSFLYWVSIYGIRQQNILPLIPETKEENNISSDTKKIDENIKSAKKTTSEDEYLVKKITQHLLLNRDYLNSNLTIADVSKSVNTHPKLVSHSINLITKKNFKSYINSFRVEEAKRLLNDNSSNKLSIEGIGLEVGFKSKSVFYNAFKKETGLTPLKFKTLNSPSN